MAKNQWYTELVNLNTKGGSKEIADWFYKSDNRKNIMFFRELPKELHSYYLSICNELEGQRSELTQDELNIIKSILLKKEQDDDFYFITYTIVLSLNKQDTSNTFIITNDFFRQFLDKTYEFALKDTLDHFLFDYIDIGDILTKCIATEADGMAILSSMYDNIDEAVQNRRDQKGFYSTYLFYNKLLIKIFEEINSEEIDDRLIDNFYKYFDIKFLKELYRFDISNFSLFFDAAFTKKIESLDRTNNQQRTCIKLMIKILSEIITDSYNAFGARSTDDHNDLYYYLYNRLDKVPNINGCNMFGNSHEYRHDVDRVSGVFSTFSSKELDIITRKLVENNSSFSEFVKAYIHDTRSYDRDYIIWSLTHSKSLFSNAKILLNDFSDPKPTPVWFPGSNTGAALAALAAPAPPPALPAPPPALPAPPPALPAPPVAPSTPPPAPPPAAPLSVPAPGSAAASAASTPAAASAAPPGSVPAPPPAAAPPGSVPAPPPAAAPASAASAAPPGSTAAAPPVPPASNINKTLADLERRAATLENALKKVTG